MTDTSGHRTRPYCSTKPILVEGFMSFFGTLNEININRRGEDVVFFSDSDVLDKLAFSKLENEIDRPHKGHYHQRLRKTIIYRSWNTKNETREEIECYISTFFNTYLWARVCTVRLSSRTGKAESWESLTNRTLVLYWKAAGVKSESRGEKNPFIICLG